MNDDNPYSAPQASDGHLPPPLQEAQVQGTGGVWRDGPILVMHKGATLPNIRCIKTGGAPDGGLLKRKLQWHHPALVLLVCAGLLVYVIVALIMTKRATIHIPISAAYRSRRIKFLWAAWLTFFASIALIAGGIAVANGGPNADPIGVAMIFLGIGAVIVAIFVGQFGARAVYPQKITDTHIWLKGVHADYLADLPPLPGVV